MIIFLLALIAVISGCTLWYITVYTRTNANLEAECAKLRQDVDGLIKRELQRSKNEMFQRERNRRIQKHLDEVMDK